MSRLDEAVDMPESADWPPEQFCSFLYEEVTKTLKDAIRREKSMRHRRQHAYHEPVDESPGNTPRHIRETYWAGLERAIRTPTETPSTNSCASRQAGSPSAIGKESAILEPVANVCASPFSIIST